EGTVSLEAGLHPIVVTFFEKSGGQVLEVYWKNTAHGVVARQRIPDAVLQVEATDSIPAVEEPQEPVAADTTEILKRYQINITKQGAVSGLDAWFDITLDNVSESHTFENITDTEGNVSDLSITAYNGMSGSTILGVADNQTGLAGGIYPDNVLRYAAYTTGKGALQIQNLDPSKLYNVRVLGGRSGSGERVTQYTIDGSAKTLQCMNNNSQVQVFEAISPNANKKLDIEFQQGGNTWAYINAIVIEEVGVKVGRVSAQETKKSGNDEEHATILGEVETQQIDKISVYPNPFQDKLTIDLDGVDYRSANVSVMDQYGQTVYQTTTDVSIADSGQLNIDFMNQVTRSGVYIVRVELDNKTTKMFRLLAE
ncbi:MAG: T9SS type A sorting domain-containing protein, partial [Cyclobacteriaceae bacterium]